MNAVKTSKKINYSELAFVAVVNLLLFNLLIFLIFIVILKTSYEKMFGAPYFVLSLIPIMNAVFFALTNRDMQLNISEYHAELKPEEKIEFMLNKRGYVVERKTANVTAWKFGSLKKILTNYHLGKVKITINTDSITIDGKKPLINDIETMLHWNIDKKG